MVRRDLKYIFWTVCQIDGIRKCMLKVLIVKNCFLKYVNMFERMGIAENIYDVVVEESDLNIFCTEIKWGWDRPCKILLQYEWKLY